MMLNRLGLRSIGIAMTAMLFIVVGIRSDAQQATRRNAGRSSAQTMSPIAITHHTFEEAVRVMEAALPIYDGHRHRAIELAKMAAKEIRDAAVGAPNSSTSGRHLTAAQRAAEVPKGPNTELSKFTAAQISASNVKMQQGLQLLNQGLQQIQALGNDQYNHMADALTFGNHAVLAANAALQYISTKQ